MILSTALAAGCGAATSVGAGSRTTLTAAHVTDASYFASVRAFHGLDLEDEERLPMRDRIVAYLAQEADARIEAADYDGVIETLASIVDVHTPEEIGTARIAPGIEPLLRFVVEQGSRRGDEGRVLAALFLLKTVRPDDAQIAAQYTELVGWGREARANLPGPFESFRKLIEVWEEHARLAPAPEVLDGLADLYIAQFNAVASLFRREGQPIVPDANTYQQLAAAGAAVRRTPFDVAAVYLRHGDLASAAGRVDRLGDATALVRLLEQARAGGPRSNDALLALAEGFAGNDLDRLDVTEGLARLGQRRDPTDPRFPIWLARIAQQRGDPAGATAYYARAIELAPGEQPLYDEALEALSALIEVGEHADASSARQVASEAEQILVERTRRFPNAPASVSMEQLHFAIGEAEMQAGNIDEAKRRYEASLAVRETAPALLGLGTLYERTGDASQAARLYRRALDRTPERNRLDAGGRAEILEHLGDALRASGDRTQATRMYTEALMIWDRLAPTAAGATVAPMQLRRGVLLDRLGRSVEATSAFEQALASAPGARALYIQTLSYLVAGTPNPELALETFRRAQRQLVLEPEWKVYLALWVQAISGRAAQAVDGEVLELLRGLARDGDAWWSKLARFGAGDLSFEDLLAAAATRGERVEATFYEAARRLGANDRVGAEALLQQVLELGMVSFFEHAMAQALLADLAPPASSPAATSASPATSAASSTAVPPSATR